MGGTRTGTEKEMTQKNCAQCKKRKELIWFHRNATTKDGFDCYCKDCRKVYFKARQKRNKEREYSKRRNAKFPLKRTARILINNNIRLGKLKKENCFLCGKFKKIIAHHLLYEFPFKIIWLCDIHHRLVHLKDK